MQPFDLIAQFSEMLVAEKNLAPQTLEAYRRDLVDFSQFLGPKTFDKVVDEDFREYLKHLAQKKVSARTIARRLASLNGFYLFLLSENYVSENPLYAIEGPRLSKS